MKELTYTKTTHNLPNQPYMKFFGRENTISKIKDELIEGGTYIASIDGIGGIGKTALAYYFCKEYLLKSGDFSYLVWVTAKNTVFDAFATDNQIINIKNEFKDKPIEILIDETIRLAGFPEFLKHPFLERKSFFEEIVKDEKIFFVLDNLETINNPDFFTFLRKFNKYSRNNRYLKVLTTSRKRKKIADFPIEIQGLSLTKAYDMLIWLAENNREKRILEIINSSEKMNLKLIERVGKIPLAIEFIIGQLIRGKSRGQIFQELEGYPSIEDAKTPKEKKQRMSEIILFSFKDMYESLNTDTQLIFKIITSLHRNRSKKDEPITIETLMNYSNFDSGKLEQIIDELYANQLIAESANGEIIISKMAINFAKQHYIDYDEIENKVLGLKNAMLNKEISKDKVDLFLERLKIYLNDLDYKGAENSLINAIERIEDYRLYHELAKVQTVLYLYSKASENFRRATELNPTNKNIWFDWIKMEQRPKRRQVAINIAINALKETSYDTSIAKQYINIYKYLKRFEILREEAKKIISQYNNERIADKIEFLREWKSIELTLLVHKEKNIYLQLVDKLVKEDDSIENKIKYLKEKKKVHTKYLKIFSNDKINSKIRLYENKIKNSINYFVKDMNYYTSSKDRDYEKAKKIAKKILTYSDKDTDIEYEKNALRVLLQIHASERDWERILITFEDHKRIALNDENCKSVYAKAKKMIAEEEQENMIQKITTHLINSEEQLRIFVIELFENDITFEDFVNKRNSKLVSKWEYNRNRALKNDLHLIYYSSLGEMKKVLNWLWLEHNFILNYFGNSKTNEIKLIIKQVVKNLKEYTIDERNETFHSRVAKYSKEQLNEVIVDTSRLFSLVKKLNE